MAEEPRSPNGNFGNELFKFEGPAAALRPLEAGLALCQERGIIEEAHWLSVGIVDCLAELGRWNQAMRLADQQLARHADLAESYEGVNLAARKAHILLFRDARTEAGLLKEAFLSRGRHIGDLQVVANVFPIAALIDQASGDFHTAALLVDELERATRNGPACYRAMPLPDVARVCAAAGRLTLAERFLEGAEAPAARYQHCLVTGQAVLAEARGDLQEAAELYADASDRWSSFGVVLEHGQALLGLGRCAARLGRRSSVCDWLLDARRVFVQLDARPLVAETDGWPHQVAAQTS